ncbi:MAG: hypothetical protein U1C48_06320 [Methylotenera sp.]|nr:hypothetical protein [Methylotenera sp.]
MFKLLLVCTLCAITFTACEKQKQAATEVGAIPKQMMDKATEDLNNAQAPAAERLKSADSIDAPENVEK